MAANETVNIQQIDVQSVVNRWLVDYYLSLGLELFKKEQYEDFCGIINVLDSILVRPYESTDIMPTKIWVLQFLSRINEGENFDTSFESDQSISPLESALMLLEKINQEYTMPQQDLKNVCTSIKEMIVGIFIKNEEFERGKEALRKHFPKAMVGKKAVFMGLIRQKSKTHEVIEQMDFKRFKMEMLAFCQRLCPFTVPFLYKAAKELLDKRLVYQDDKPAETEREAEPGPSSSLQLNVVQFVPCIPVIIPRTRLEAAYNALAKDPKERTFVKLEEEVEQEEQEEEVLCLQLSPDTQRGADVDTEQEVLFQRDADSPMEASPADEPPQTDAAPQTQAASLSQTAPVRSSRQLYSVARLVVEPDSLTSLQCSAASQELEPEVTTEKPAETLAGSSKTDPQCPVTDTEVPAPIKKRRRRSNTTCHGALHRMSELSGDGEEDSPVPVAWREVSEEKLRGKSRKSKRLSSSEEDSEEQTFCKTPVQTPNNSLNRDPGTSDEDSIMDSSLDSSPSLFPRTSSTPRKDSAQDNDPSHSKWKMLYKNAVESKETWSDEESCFTSKKNSGSNQSPVSNSSQRRRKWTESETQKLREGVHKFGEGNWSKIKAYYKFSGRTNVNLKDRWRTINK